MADDKLREFYAKAGKVLPIINRWRVALPSNNQNEIEIAATEFCECMRSWESEISAVARHTQAEKEWRIAYGIWKHSGSRESAPPEPRWPDELPDSYDTLCITEAFMRMLELAPVPECFFVDEDSFTWQLETIITWFDSLERLIQAPEGDDGPIDRSKLADLLGLQPKTLANRKDELPEPIGRNSHNVPIYMYSAARAALIAMYPDKAFMLPAEYSLLNWTV